MRERVVQGAALGPDALPAHAADPVGIGIYLALPSGRPVLGVAVILVAGFTGYLLVNKAATDWINRFPLPFGEAQDR